MDQGPLPIHKFFGNLDDYFYQLGLKDREGHKMLLQHAKKILSGNISLGRNLSSGLISKALDIVSQQSESHETFHHWCKMYAQGLGAKKEDVTFAFLLPDLMCSLGSWLPGIPYYMLGCSSVFSWCEKREALVHGRILDFPFTGSFDKEERALQTQLNNESRVFSLGSQGLPFPITAMSEHGFSFALHQKFTTICHLSGTPIFEIVHNILNRCQTKKDILDYLESIHSIASWGLYFGFKNGEVLAVNLLGDRFIYDEYNIEQGDLLYFNNRLLEEDCCEKYAQPYGNKEFSEMREVAFYKKCDQLNIEKNISAESLLKLLSTPLSFKKKDHFLCDVTTITSLQTSCLIPALDECLFLPGLSPKLFKGKVDVVTDCFLDISVQQKSLRGKKVNESYQEGLTHLQKAQRYHDQKETHLSYHHIQMAHHFFKDHPYEDIAQFYFCVFQYIYDDGKKHLSRTLGTLRNLLDSSHLPTYLKDHCRLFIARLEKMRNEECSISIDEITSLALQRVFEFEQSMPRTLFHQTTKSFMSARIDMLDIVYPHVKVSS